MSKVIFTIGHRPLLPFTIFIQRLKTYGVNCVVDIREEQSGAQYGEYDQIVLREKLKEYRTFYLSFLDEFGQLDCNGRKQGKIVYENAIEKECFKKGILRLEKGLEKGFTIALLGAEQDPLRCFRANVIGRYLHNNGWQVLHILPNGILLSQDRISEKDKEQEEEKALQEDENLMVGHTGEMIAAQYLSSCGFRILDMNWNLHKGCELDIVAFKSNTIHAIEVKTRTSDQVIAPEQAISREKMANIQKAFNAYRSQKRLFNIPAQIDSIAVVFRSSDDYTVNMYENLQQHMSRFYR